jgi:hypothetical protein
VHQEIFAGNALSSGVYMYRLLARTEKGETYLAFRKMILLK